jgi:hypothetical protein
MAPPDDPKGLGLWLRAPDCAKLALAYIETVLEAPRAKGCRTGENLGGRGTLTTCYRAPSSSNGRTTPRPTVRPVRLELPHRNLSGLAQRNTEMHAHIYSNVVSCL